MKKITLSLLLLVIVFFNGFSQKDTLIISKSGKVVLPQKGDIAIGIGANSFFNFAGNIFSSSGTNSLNLNLLNNNVIYGKYFINSRSAFRLKLGISQSTKNIENKVLDDNNNANKVTDKYDKTSSDIDITLGYERRKGASRLQLSYGAEFGIYYQSIHDEYTYGNSFSTENMAPNSTINFDNMSTGQLYMRAIEYKRDNGIAIGIRVFTGIEYFILPKISIGGELGLSYYNRSDGEGVMSYESWDFDNNEVKVEKNTSNTKFSNINTDIFSGQIFLLFHFK